MTRNIFLGADLTPAYEALEQDPAALPAAVASIYNPGEPPGTVQRTDFATRAAGLAHEIAAVKPDLLALQEAAAWRTRTADGDVTVDDHLATLEAALQARGARYRRVVTADVGDVELPSATGVTVGLTNRLAILARDDDGLRLSEPQSGSYAGTLPIQTPLGPIGLARGWASVDVEHDGAALRFVTTHLEVAASPAAAEAQLAQAGELLAGPADTPQPVVLAGDFNARPGSAGYERIRAGGFEDAWTQVDGDAQDGLTCCHRFPLDDPADRLRTRIDLILLRGGVVAREAFVVGEFGPGIWPSDHSGVVARLQTDGR
jgi:endonuclease/exonuclease/phosphatase family metal-dependent hydrolase